MDARCEVLILGGGVIGLTTAYYLARTGVRVTVLEKGAMGGEASWAGAGIIPPGNPERARQPWDRLRSISVAAFPNLSQDLLELTGIDNGYFRCGAVELDSGVDAALLAAWRDEGIAFERVMPRDLHATQPGLGSLPESGYFLPDAAQLRNPWHLRALVAACTRLNVSLQCESPVNELLVQGNRIHMVRGAGKTWVADRYLIAAGAWTENLLRPLGASVRVRPIRGQMVLFNMPAAPFRSIVLQGSRYLVPRRDGRVLAGSTEEEVGFDRSTTAVGTAELRSFAVALAPGLSGAEIEKTWAGLRPATPDGLPYLGPVPGIDNLFIAAGHFRAGIQLSPATGQVMADLLSGRKPVVPIAAFAVDRQQRQAVANPFRS